MSIVCSHGGEPTLVVCIISIQLTVSTVLPRYITIVIMLKMIWSSRNLHAHLLKNWIVVPLIEVGLIPRHLGKNLLAELRQGSFGSNGGKVDDWGPEECSAADCLADVAQQSAGALGYAVDCDEVLVPHYLDCVLQTQYSLEGALQLFFDTGLDPIVPSRVFGAGIAADDLDAVPRLLLLQSLY